VVDEMKVLPTSKMFIPYDLECCYKEHRPKPSFYNRPLMVNGSEFLRLNGGESRRGEKKTMLRILYLFWSIVALLLFAFGKKKLLDVARTQKQRLQWIDRKGESKVDRG